jgi:hypothetical protein
MIANTSDIYSNACKDSLGHFTHPAHDEIREAWLPDSEPAQIPLNQFAGIASNEKPFTLETTLSLIGVNAPTTDKQPPDTRRRAPGDHLKIGHCHYNE